MNLAYPDRHRFAFLLFAIFCTTLFNHSSAADEVIISGASYEKLSAGDFSCGACRTPMTSGLPLTQLNSSCCEIKAGDLYRFYKSQGIDSLNELVLCLDVPSVQNKSSVAFSSIEFKIEGQSNIFDNGQKTIILPGYESSGLKPEARLTFDLGYDFMERFTESSTETVSVDFSFTSQEVAEPTFFLEGDRPWTPNVLIVSLFVGGSILLLTILFMLTKPGDKAKDQKRVPSAPLSNSNAIAT